MNRDVNKIITSILSMSVALAVLPINISAQDYEGWEVNLKYSGYEIRGYNGTDSVVTIPDELNGRKVVEYSYDIFKNSPTVKEVTLNNTVTTTIRDMFRGAANLNKITYGKTAYSEIAKINNSNVKIINFSLITDKYVLNSDCLDPCEGLEEINFGNNVYLQENASVLPNLNRFILGPYNKMKQVSPYTIMSDDGTRVLLHCTSEDKDYFGLSKTSYVDIMKFYNADCIVLEPGLTSLPKGYVTGTNLKALLIPDSVTYLPEYSIGYNKIELAIGWGYERRDDFEIYSPIGSEAQQYAFKYNFKYYPTEYNEDSVFGRFIRKEATSADALKVLQQVVGCVQESGKFIGVGDDLDVDRDEFVTSEDALMILQQVVGLYDDIPEFYGFDPEILNTPIINPDNVEAYVNKYRPTPSDPVKVPDITEKPLVSGDMVVATERKVEG